MNSFKLFLTYGDAKFPKSRKRIVEQASALEVFDDCLAENHETIARDNDWKKALTNKHFLNVAQQPRGGGYWIWKPYVIYKHLQKLSAGDFLIYADAGLTIPPPDGGPWEGSGYAPNKFKEYFKLLEDHKTPWISIPVTWLEAPEAMWTKMDVPSHFNCLNDFRITTSPQFSADRHVIKKSPHSLEIARLWWETAKLHPHLFDDSRSRAQNDKNFTDHRHDQSVFSIIAKLKGVIKEDFRNFPILRTRIHE